MYVVYTYILNNWRQKT